MKHAHRFRSSGFLLVLLIGVGSCRPRSARDGAIDPQLVVEWVRHVYGAMRTERLSAPVASRVSAYASLALYAGVSAARPSFAPSWPTLRRTIVDAPALPAPPRALDPTIVAMAAQRVVLADLLMEALPTTRAAMTRFADSVETARLHAGVDSADAAHARRYGEGIGAVLVTWAHADGFAGTRRLAYTPPVGDSLWINDAPATLYATQNLSAVSEFVAFDNPANAQRSANLSDRSLILSRPKRADIRTLPAANIAGITEPYWGTLRRFLPSSDSCRLRPPPAYGVDTNAPILQGARAVHARSRTLTPHDRLTALYWADNAGESGTPVGHWLSIAAQQIRDQQLDGDAALRLVTGTALVQADAFMLAWRAKFASNVLRPRTMIRRHLDPRWEPVIPTPPFPEYPSGHSTQSAAAAAMLTALLGPQPFTDRTVVSLGHTARSFPSFRAASDEAGRSRVLAGLHYPVSDTAGAAYGRCIGSMAAQALFDRFSSSATP